MAATDFLNQPLEAGSVVIIRRPEYADLTVGVVLKLTAIKAHVAYMRHYGDNCAKHLIDQSCIVATTNQIAHQKAETIKASAIKQGWLNP